MKPPLVIIMGDPIHGFVVIGPFNHIEDVAQYVDSNEDEDMWIVELIAPASVHEEEGEES